MGEEGEVRGGRGVGEVRGEGVDEEGRLERSVSRAASDVARDFREALGDAAFATFKTCTFSVPRTCHCAIELQGSRTVLFFSLCLLCLTRCTSL